MSKNIRNNNKPERSGDNMLKAADVKMTRKRQSIETTNAENNSNEMAVEKAQSKKEKC